MWFLTCQLAMTCRLIIVIHEFRGGRHSTMKVHPQFQLNQSLRALETAGTIPTNFRTNKKLQRSPRTVQPKWRYTDCEYAWVERYLIFSCLSHRCLADIFLGRRFGWSRIIWPFVRHKRSIRVNYSLRSASYINIDYRAFSNKLWCL